MGELRNGDRNVEGHSCRGSESEGLRCRSDTESSGDDSLKDAVFLLVITVLVLLSLKGIAWT